MVALYPLSQIDPALLAEAARLHESVLPILLSKMGHPFALRYFQAAAKDEAVIGFYALSEEGHLLGYVVGSPRPDRLNAQLTRPRLWFLGQCLRLLFTRPLVLWQAVVSSLTQSKQIQAEEDAVELTYIAVSPRARGQGLGRALMLTFHEAARAAGYRRVTASQELDNASALQLFDSLGYKTAYTFREGRYHRRRAVLEL